MIEDFTDNIYSLTSHQIYQWGRSLTFLPYAGHPDHLGLHWLPFINCLVKAYTMFLFDSNQQTSTVLSPVPSLHDHITENDKLQEIELLQKKC